MTWHYYQATGHLDHGAAPIGEGYSGRGSGLNNPVKQSERNVGPIPVGSYTIGPAFQHPVCGPLSMRLHPAPTNEMFGRDGFLIHGDTAAMDHTASDGCIILNRQWRGLVSLSEDSQLVVETTDIE